jgi:hemolysin activation/secretion protein
MVQGSFNYVQSLPAGFSVGFNLNGQYANATVPQNQQWVIGGFGNLTAFLPAVLVGDGGGLGRLNLGAPSWAWKGYSITGSAFVEAGLVRSHFTPANAPTTRTLADAGLSLSGNTPFGTSLSLAYAWPIASRNVDLDAVNQQFRANLYFSLNQSF